MMRPDYYLKKIFHIYPIIRNHMQMQNKMYKALSMYKNMLSALSVVLAENYVINPNF